MYYVLYFLAGVLAGNGVPHFVKGIMGESHRTPFGDDSSAVTNVTWGTANFLVAWLVWHYSGLHRSLVHTVRYEICFGLGVYAIALALAYTWSHASKRRK